MIVPSIDLMNGNAVQLVGGKELELDAGDPRPLAERFGRVGEVAVIDLDAALGQGSNADTIRDQMQRLEESQRVAAQNEKLAALGGLAAGVAHEVRNPLGVIRASAAMVQESFDPEEEPYRACQFICEETDRLNGLITALLGFARPARLRRSGADQPEPGSGRAKRPCSRKCST